MAEPDKSRRMGSRLIGVPVLVVEDDPPTARLVSVILANEGCDVRVVRSAEEALALLPAFVARVVVVDLILPRMSGLLLARQLKADPSTRDIVIVATSFADPADIDQVVRDAGCSAYLAKPIDAFRLADTVVRLALK